MESTCNGEMIGKMEVETNRSLSLDITDSTQSNNFVDSEHNSPIHKGVCLPNKDIREENLNADCVKSNHIKQPASPSLSENVDDLKEFPTSSNVCVSSVEDLPSNFSEPTENNLESSNEPILPTLTNDHSITSHNSLEQTSDNCCKKDCERDLKEVNSEETMTENNSVSDLTSKTFENHSEGNEVNSLLDTTLSEGISTQNTVVSSVRELDVEIKDEKAEKERTFFDFHLPLSGLSPEDIGFPTFFEGLVKVGNYISVKGDFTLKSSEALIESPSLVSPFLLKEPDKFPVNEKETKSEIKGFFRSSVGEFLISLGLSRVNEWYHRDMSRIKNRIIKKEGKSTRLEQELELHQSFFLQAKKANEPFSFPYKSCRICNFCTESSIVLEGHLLVPHITARREYRCSFCDVVSRDPRVMLFHMEANHHKTGRIQPPVLFYECPYCTFESNSKVKLNSHMNRCQKYFDRATNQAPPKDFDVPALTPKPITVAVVKAYEKSISCMQRGRGRPKKIDHVPDSFHHHLNQIAGSLNNRNMAFNQNISMFRPLPTIPLSDGMGLQGQSIPSVQVPTPTTIRPAHSNNSSVIRQGPPPPLHLSSANRFFQVVNSSGQMLPVLGNNQIPAQFSFMPNPMNSSQKKAHSSHAMNFYNNLYNSGMRQQMPMKSSDHHVTITPTPPKLQGPYPVQLNKSSPPNTPLQSSSLVVCEICDGYIKDLEQLRAHMQLIHKVKIHPKMLVSRPPLNCQKCQWRFFTDQGLERHLLGAHGLVTSNMQELANKNKDAGCCTICGRVYASKLVAHMNQIHKVTLKPAHLSYKCTVCSATFNLYRLFENHVYLVHSGAAKRPSDNNDSSSSKKIAKFSHSEKLELVTDNSAKSPSEKENHSVQKLPACELDNNAEEERFTVKCKGCGDDMNKSCDRKRLASEWGKHSFDKCEKCLRSGNSIVSLDGATSEDGLDMTKRPRKEIHRDK